ncbi:MAG: hypothetical protein IJ867_07030 [Clostridia bacterium]|nr:hypothetical protein [Clostridia bacterium]
MSFFRKSGIVNVKMIITEEKILSNIDKIQKLINPNSKKQIVQLEEDSYFKDLVESVKTYLLEYPRKKNFPAGVYKAAYDLVEYATNQFEENTKKIEELIRKRERNIKLASVLRDVTNAVKGKAKNWREIIKKLQTKYSSDVVEALTIIGNSKDNTSEEYEDACKLIDAKINNLESNLHIEIDMERIEDRSKALSYIGIEIAEALKYIPAPAIEFTKEETTSSLIVQEDANSEISGIAEETTGPVSEVAQEIAATETEEISQENGVEEEEENLVAENVTKLASNENEIEEDVSQDVAYIQETRFEAKPSLWQRIKNSKIVRTISYVLKIRVVLDYPALPEGNLEDR